MPSRFSSNDEVVISQQSGCTHLTIETNSSNSLFLSANGKVFFQNYPNVTSNSTLHFNTISANGIVIEHLSHANSLQSVVIQANSVIQDNSTNPGKVGGYRYIKTFTSNTTWTIPKGVTRVRFVAVGGGGGSGAAGIMANGTGGVSQTSSVPGGGGGGATAVKHYEGNISEQSIRIIVGRGGNGGVGYSDSATLGGTNNLNTPTYETTTYGAGIVNFATTGLPGEKTVISFGNTVLVSADGGAGGSGAGYEGTVTVFGGAGGQSGANADFYIPGANGQQGQQTFSGTSTSFNQLMFMGFGGGSSLGYANTSHPVQAPPIVLPFPALSYGYGAGGSGPNIIGLTTGYFGTSGTNGIVVVEFG